MEIQQPDRALQLVQPIDESSISAKVAMATSDRLTVDEHFGTASHFLIFALLDQQWQLQKIIEYGATQRKHEQNKLLSRIESLADCNAVYANAIGPSAVKKLLKLQVQPVIVAEKSPIQSLLTQLINDEKNGHAPWLKPNLSKTANVKAQPLTREKMLDLLDEEWD